MLSGYIENQYQDRMGVHDLWSLLQPVAKKVPLDSLKGKTLSVDLSGWIVESMQCSGLQTKKNPHLSNLFYRCAKLLSHDINLVFVLEGECPPVKYETLSRRNGGENEGKITGKRTRLQASINKCKRLLDTLGVCYVCGEGEGEAGCAFLDANGFVDGCFTEDSDAFLYGAKTVYRDIDHFSKDPHVYEYRAEDVHSQLGLDRRRLVALGVLLGCDYFPGVEGVGKDKAVKLLKHFDELKVDALKRLEDWSSDEEFCLMQDKLDQHIKKERHCSHCGHVGSSSEHKKHGCVKCGTTIDCKKSGSLHQECECDWHSRERFSSLWKLELQIRQKALATASFPPHAVIDEFLRLQGVKDVGLKENFMSTILWKIPNLEDFQVFMNAELCWDAERCRNKILPLIARWQLLHPQAISACNTMQAYSVEKIRVRNGIEFYEVKWKGVPDVEGGTMFTLEPKDIFEVNYPQVVKEFVRSEEERKKVAGRKKGGKKALIADSNNGRITDFFNVVKSVRKVENSASRQLAAPVSVSIKKEEVVENEGDNDSSFANTSFLDVPLAERLRRQGRNVPAKIPVHVDKETATESCATDVKQSSSSCSSTENVSVAEVVKQEVFLESDVSIENFNDTPDEALKEESLAAGLDDNVRVIGDNDVVKDDDNPGCDENDNLFDSDLFVAQAAEAVSQGWRDNIDDLDNNKEDEVVKDVVCDAAKNCKLTSSLDLFLKPGDAFTSTPKSDPNGGDVPNDENDLNGENDLKLNLSGNGFSDFRTDNVNIKVERVEKVCLIEDSPDDVVIVDGGDSHGGSVKPKERRRIRSGPATTSTVVRSGPIDEWLRNTPLRSSKTKRECRPKGEVKKKGDKDDDDGDVDCGTSKRHDDDDDYVPSPRLTPSKRRGRRNSYCEEGSCGKRHSPRKPTPLSCLRARRKSKEVSAAGATSSLSYDASKSLFSSYDGECFNDKRNNDLGVFGNGLGGGEVVVISDESESPKF